MVRETILTDFQNWSKETQLSEYQAYIALGDFSPLLESDYIILKSVIDNHNAEILCENGVCKLVNETLMYGDGDWEFTDSRIGISKISIKDFNDNFKTKFISTFKSESIYFGWYEPSGEWFIFNNLTEDDLLLFSVMQVKDYNMVSRSQAKQIVKIDIAIDFRNKGLSTFIYKSIKDKTNWTLVSDYIQFEGTRKIWYSISKKEGVKIYDADTKELSDYITISDFNDSTIWGFNHKNKLLVYESKSVQEMMNNCSNTNIISETTNKGTADGWDFNEFSSEPKEIPFEVFGNGEYFTKNYKGDYYNIYWDGFNKWYLILDDNEKYYIIGYLKLIKYDNLPNTMQVDGIEIHKNFRNKGLSTFLYRMIKSKKQYSIVSDYIQYTDSRKTWTSLAKKDGVKIYDEETDKKSDFISISDYNDESVWGAKHNKKLLVLESYTIENKLNGDKTLKEQILESFSDWDKEKQLSEYQYYKAYGDSSPFNDMDYVLMKNVIDNQNVLINCENGICNLVNESSMYGVGDKDFGNFELGNTKIKKDNYSKIDGIKIYDENTNELSDYVTIDDIEDKSIWNDKNAKQVFVFEKKLLSDDNIDARELMLETTQNDNTNSMVTIFSDLLSNTKVKNAINAEKNKQKIIKIYKAVLPLLTDVKKKDKIEQNFKKVMSKITTAAKFENWESIITANFKAYITKLESFNFISKDSENEDKFIFNYDKINPNIIYNNDKLSTLLLLGLTNYLPATNKKTFYKTMVDTLFVNGIEDNIDNVEFDEIIKNIDPDQDTTDDEKNIINDELEQLIHHLEVTAMDVKDLKIVQYDEAKVKMNDKRIKKSFEEYYNTYIKKSGESDLVFDPLRLEANMRESYVTSMVNTSKNDKIQLEKFLSRIEKNNVFPDKITKAEILTLLQYLDTTNEVEFTKSDSANEVLNAYKLFIKDKEVDVIKTKISEIKKKFDDDETTTNELLNKDMDNFIAAKLSTILNAVGAENDKTEVLNFYKQFKINNQSLNNINPGPGEIKTVLNTTFEYMKKAGLPWSKYAEKLINHSDSAEGRGEKFIEFALPYSSSGGQSSYDLKIGPMIYEIKTYTIKDNTIAPIRLGQEGNVFKVEKFARLFIFLSDVSKLFNNEQNNYKLLITLFSNSMTEKNFMLISKMLNDSSMTGSKYSLIDQLRKGEFSNSHMTLFQKVIKLLEKSLIGVKQNNFYFMKIFLKDKNLDLAITPLDTTNSKLTGNIESGETITFETKDVFSKSDQEEMVSTILRILSNKEIFEENYLNQIVAEAITGINKEFKMHPMIILNDFKTGDHDIACGGIFTEFYFHQITQNKFKIVPVGLKAKTNN